jgi:hypothetical protein
MKTIIYSITIIISVVLLSASEIRSKGIKSYKIIPEETIVTWTAFKTTDKIPVTGIFKEVIIENEKSGSTISEMLNGIKFSLPINSIFSQSNLRDGKIKKFFFGNMINTSKISGEIKLIDNTNGLVTIIMNGMSEELPINFKISDNSIIIDAEMDLNNWKAQMALSALSDACEDLHTGPDGETVTWSDVKINVTSKVRLE